MKQETKKKIMYASLIVGLILLIAGVSYAFFTADFKGYYDNELAIGQNLYFRYNETSEGLLLDNTSVLSDEAGKNQDKYFDFEVSLTSSLETDVGYNIYITKDATSNLNEENIKLYLTDQEDNTITNVRTIKSLARHNTIEDSYYLYSKII